ncbi:MAG: ketoacyl-ACP synthase III [Ignavibacteriales bacterium]|nr:ketoacyl-ACP synthase III [Ignavibacteriales bacterium]MCF8315109.1 ketoacyl-ACP synthase III [Ignavibacteriales bacterium]MCF8435895.1 ketoacyl-ACP synthase III [Ignavibacteriales bacterium]
MAYIKKISYYLPEKILDNQEISRKFPEWSMEKIGQKTGITERRVCGKDELSSDMAVKVAEKFFEEHNIDRAEIDFLLVCSMSPDYPFPANACLVQDLLGMKKSTAAMDYALGCSGYLYGLAVAKGLVDTGISKNLLLITSETITKYIHPEDKSNITLFGDAAAATLISTDGECSLDNFVLGTDGSGKKHIIMHRGGMRNPSMIEVDEKIDEFGNVRNINYLHMDGPEVFNFTLETVPPLIKEVLEKAKLALEDIDLFIFHQANAFMLEHLRRILKIPKEKFFMCMEHTGNTVASTIPIAMYEAAKQGKIKKGGKVLLAAFGTGYSWGSCILDYEAGY